MTREVRFLRITVPDRLTFPRPRITDTWPDMTGLRPYQVCGVQWLATRQYALLADEMRLGKTAQALRSLPPRASAVVVCPAIVRLVWRDEINLWRPDLRPLVSDTLRAPGDGEIVILSYDALPDPPPGWCFALSDGAFRKATLILDEAHYVKSDDALRTQRVRLLSSQCGRVLGITGTPLVGTLSDLWGVLVSCRLSDPFRTELAFRKRFRGHSLDRIAETLGPLILRRTVAQVFPELPPKIYCDVPVEAPADLRPFLDQVTAQWEALDGKSLPPFEMVSEARKALARSRIDDAFSLAREMVREGGPLVIFSCHREPVLAMGDMRRAGVLVGETPPEERAQLVQAFQAGDLDVLAMTVDVGGVGIDLSRSDQILEIDLDYTPGVNMQAEARCTSVKKQRPVRIARMVTDHPLDRRILEILASKQALQARILGA